MGNDTCKPKPTPPGGGRIIVKSREDEVKTAKVIIMGN